jgi:RNA polymerase sigma-70 factor, ECF subfamily
LLREVFEAGYAEIASVLDRSETACRQMVHRAKERVRRDRSHVEMPPAAREQVTRRFVEALRAEDRDGLLALLTGDAILVADGGGRVPAAAEVQRGADRVAQLLVGFERATRLHLERAGLPMPEYELAWLNEDPAVLTLASGKLLFATVLHLDSECIVGVYRVMNPAKLAGLGRPMFLDTAES